MTTEKTEGVPLFSPNTASLFNCNVHPKTRNIPPAILSQFVLGPIPEGLETPCWLWTGTVDKYGYPRTSKRCRACLNGQIVYRITYQLTKGKLSFRQNLLKKCGIRKCGNPDHHVTVCRGEVDRRC